MKEKKLKGSESAGVRGTCRGRGRSFEGEGKYRGRPSRPAIKGRLVVVVVVVLVRMVEISTKVNGTRRSMTRSWLAEDYSDGKFVTGDVEAS